MKKLLYILMLLTITFTACRKDEHFTETETEIPDSVEIEAPEDPIIPTDTTSFKMSGKISNQLGTPLNQTTVNLYHGGGFLTSTTTDEWGKYTFNDLDASEQDYFLETDHHDFASNVKIRSIKDEDERADFVLIDANNDFATVNIDPTDTTLTSVYGHVYQGNENNPASNIYLIVSAPTQEYANFTVSNENGFYEMVVPKGENVQIFSFDILCGYPQAEPIESSFNTVTELENIYVDYSPTNTLLNGIIVDCNNNPIGNIEDLGFNISLLNSGGVSHISINEADGTFQISSLSCENQIQDPIIIDIETGQYFSTIFDGETLTIQWCQSTPSTLVIGNDTFTVNGLWANDCFCSEENMLFSSIASDYSGSIPNILNFTVPELGIESLGNNIGQSFVIENFIFFSFENDFDYIASPDYALTFTLSSIDEESGEYISGIIQGDIYDENSGQTLAIWGEIYAQF